jgi:hypothetical protein
VTDTAQTGSPLTLPLSAGDRPFELSQAEASLVADDWAWLFLRLNPYYMHDYRLCIGAPEPAWLELRERRRPGSSVVATTNRLRALIDGGTGKTNATEFLDRLSEAVARLDSRYFAVGKQPLTGSLDGLRYCPLSLAEYLAKSADPTLLQRITIRDFDAARDYGVGTWLDPRKRSLPRLDAGCSWFFHANEPIWAAHTWAIRSPKFIYHALESGEKVIVGSEGHASEVTEEMRVYLGANDKNGSLQRLSKGQPLPTMEPGETSTRLEFLVCLDGYIQPQLDRLLPIAEKLKDVHRKYFPEAVKRGAVEGYVPTISDPRSVITAPDLHSFNLLAPMMRDPSPLKRHWRQVCIDVGAPLRKQFEHVAKDLKAQQTALSEQLSLPIRQRTGRKGNDRSHWLKKALGAVELHLSGGEKPLSQAAVAKAFFDPASAKFPVARGISTPTSTTVLNDHDRDLAEARKAFEVGRNMVLGWYEFIAALDRP